MEAGRARCNPWHENIIKTLELSSHGDESRIGMCGEKTLAMIEDLKYWLDWARNGSRSTWGFFCLKEKSSCRPTWNLDCKFWVLRMVKYKTLQ